MSISKLRGKSAIAVQNDNNTSNHNASKLMKPYVPPTTTSLLKIEPFVPTFSTRFRKPIYRSYSTLSSSYFKRINDQKHHHRISRFPERGHLQHQRSKSTLSASTKTSQNGVYRIIRATEDQEKLPDRINYDRRGLTAIPIFENESNLRLLSLQHNLINVFHIPDESASQKTGSDCDTSGTENGKVASTPTENTGSVKPPKDGSNPKLVISGYAQIPEGVECLNLTTSGANTVAVPPSSIIPSSPNMLSPNTALAKHSFVKKSTLLHAHQKYNTLKKSKSFMNNYPPHFNTALKYNIQQGSPLMRYGPTASIVNVTSFGGEANHHTALEQDTEKCSEANSIQDLKVKNNQLSPSYGITFQNLVFLDLYDNQIEKISNLDGLKNLTVLLLGKNRITEITGLASVKNTLRVLDLHGNKIANIVNRINCLQHLKSLNLAGNQIRQINPNDFAGMTNLKELNLKRNRIKRVYGFNNLVNLERLWLCHNDIHRVDDMYSIGDATNLQEVTIENNPVSLAGDCVSFLVSYLPNLVMLSQMPISDQVRSAAMAWRRNKELSNGNQFNPNTDLTGIIRREEVISNARTNWELLRSQQVTTPSKNISSKLTSSSSSSQLCPADPEKNHIPESNRSSKPRQLSARSTKSTLNADKKKHRKCREKCDGNSEFSDFFRLPPIGQYQPPTECKTPSENTHSSGSSLGPNIDSSSSCYTSDDNEDPPRPASSQRNPETIAIRVPQVNEQPPLECEDVSYDLVLRKDYKEVQVVEDCSVPVETNLEEIATPIRKEDITSGEPSQSKDEDSGIDSKINSQSDKNSTISTNSVKSDSEFAPSNGNQSEKSGKTRNGNATNRRYMHGTLMRSQTARGRAPMYSLPSNHYNASNANNNQGSSAGANNAKQAKPVVEREREQGGDYLIEICGRYLNVYGLGALRFIDKQWNAQKANDVHTLNFSYVNFNNIAGILGRIKMRFPNAESFVFRETNINALGQLNALAELQGITTLTIDTEGNPICEKNWRPYAIYRLSHWGLKTINGIEITDSEIEQAQTEYIGLSDLVLWSLPESLLQPLLARLRLDETLSASKLSAKEWLMRADQSLKIVVGKEALQWKKSMAPSSNTLAATTSHQNPDQEYSLRDRGTMQLTMMIENTCNAVEKLQMLETLWPSLLLDIVRNTLLDYSQLDVYVKNLMAEIMK
ncbi:unnamed protein product [Hermetia illucens]|uniref:Dynein axonemal assembly factor 1 homolog n=1 Tax=Hermetia illucens TaxID=343691 RepID=A0A7R8UL09_HERIL|nr:uncharacterized protein LOC119650141 [Hermetia illucens]XP_037908602.1 uncharacterized protein LOC119650141 [Hermetia illucens]XP_037908603.1 uncharacterized protein LOC119650141 [Hermetia illucens]XP_037908604.1 uncharacterized protein LOC119650141 [Hermetia illucens]XP_037908605.1 uncharacterized protein LOC119650141 [Hermetia illucens]CAD7082790.1 unnamed protein product [Hermetia illucens]